MHEAATNPTEDELLARVAQGEREAFHALVAATQRSVYRLALAVSGNPVDAEDILQETYLAAFRAASGFRGEASARTWLLTIARHEAWRLMRKRVPAASSRSDDSEGSLETLGVSAGWGTEDPERMAARAQDRAFLARALARLPEAYREILTLRDLEGIPGETVAEMLDLALPAMKSRLHRARLALAACLREDGYHA
jgi:RNA polymerase sigma-70 factor (ECF subfamily)